MLVLFHGRRHIEIHRITGNHKALMFCLINHPRCQYYILAWRKIELSSLSIDDYCIYDIRTTKESIRFAYDLIMLTYIYAILILM